MAACSELSVRAESGPSFSSACGCPVFSYPPICSPRAWKCSKPGAAGMSLIIAFVFLAVFIAVLLLYFGFQAEPDARRKKISARLAAIPADAGSRDQDDVMNTIVRDDARSSVPWVDRILQRVDALA